LIRGIGAAILVFLLAKGGTAILTRGDASPNAYAIFFACFIAAVFSEDVWSWARRRQQDQLRGAGDKRHPMTARQSRKSKRRPLAPAMRIGRHSEEKHLPSPPAAHWLHLPLLADQQR
jgi:hypothetical protein